MESEIKIEFQKELSKLINKFGIDAYTSIPDYVLAKLLVNEIISQAKLSTTIEESRDVII